jgi:hypothetical protein
LNPNPICPVANALSFLGNHSATVLIAAGKFPDSPAANAARAIPKPKVLFTAACNMAAILQMVIEILYPSLVPILSIILPKTTSQQHM